MDLHIARLLMNETMAKYGLIEKGWRFEYGLPRAKNTFGMTYGGSRKLIEMNAEHVTMNTEAVVMQTILHEVAHAIVGVSHGHDKTWKAMAHAIGYTQGRTMAAVTPTAPYEGTCAPGCNTPHKKQRKSKHGWNVWKCQACKSQIVWRDTVSGQVLTTTPLPSQRAAASSPRLVDLSTLTEMINTTTGERTPVNFSAPKPTRASVEKGWSDWDEMFNR